MITYPLDTVRKKQQANGMLGQNKTLFSSLKMMKKIYELEGARGFYFGFVPNLVKVIPAMAIQFAAYDLLKANVVDTRLI